jgi:ABC-type glycerol-3-phosphate transport system substrate-binding protein
MTRRTSVRLGRKLVAVAGASALAIGMAGAFAGQASAASGNLNITFSTFDYSTLDQGLVAWEGITAAGGGSGVNVGVQDLSNDPSTLVPALSAAKAAGNQPDINESYDDEVPTFEVDGLAADLTPVLTSAAIYPASYWYHSFLASYIPTTSGGGVTAGHPYGVPLESDATVLLYNENEFSAKHVAFPKDGWTWTQMLKDAKKLTIGHGANTTQYGACLRPDWQAEYNPVMHAYGVNPITPTRATLSTKNALKAWQLMLTPLEKGWAVPEKIIGANAAGDCGGVFESGEAAMALAVRGGAAGYASKIGSKFAWNVVTMPLIRVGRKLHPSVGGGSVAFTMSQAVVAGGPNLTNAEHFMQYLFSTPGQTVLEDTYGVIPSIPSLNTSSAPWQNLTTPPCPGCTFPTNNAAWSIDAADAIIAPAFPGAAFSDSNIDVPNFVAAVENKPKSLKSAAIGLESQMKGAYLAQAAG